MIGEDEVLSLKQVLASRNYCDLGVLAHLHGLPMSRSRPKAQSIQRLYAHIRQHKTMMRAYRALTRRAKEALAILKACGSSLPFALFRRMYGDKMPYRPWRGDDAPTWGGFASITDMLWRLGMIDIQVGNPTRVLLVDDVRPLLPDMPLPKPMMTHAIPDGRAIVLHDLTEWLAGASARPIRLKKGRWLPIQTLRRIQKGCLMGDDMTTIRGETRTTRLRWYHYLADVAGFITHNETGIHLTVRAWEWLGWSASDRWAHLLGAMWDDWRSDNPLWRAYHLPDIQFEAWDALYRHVVACDVGMYARDDMESAFRPYLAIHPAFMPMDEADNPIFTIGDAYWDVLAWLGVIIKQSPHPQRATDGIIVSAPIEHPITPAPWRYADDALYIQRPDNPHPSAWVQLCAYAIPEGDALRVDADAIRRAITIGETIPQIADTLHRLIGATLPLRVYEHLEQWEQQAHQQSLQTVTLLTVAHTDTLRRWRADWRISKHIQQVLSPHHAVINGDDAGLFTRKLRRRGYAVLCDEPHPARLDTQREAMWLAVRVYQGISGFVPQAIRIPNAVRHGIGDAISKTRLSALEASAKMMIDRIGQAIKGYPSAGIITPEIDEIHIRAQVHSMWEACGAVNMVYFSPAYGERTTRIIESVLIYERDGAEYIEAWCRRDEAMRLFRMDRILRVVDTELIRTGHPF